MQMNMFIDDKEKFTVESPAHWKMLIIYFVATGNFCIIYKVNDKTIGVLNDRLM